MVVCQVKHHQLHLRPSILALKVGFHGYLWRLLEYVFFHTSWYIYNMYRYIHMYIILYIVIPCKSWSIESSALEMSPGIYSTGTWLWTIPQKFTSALAITTRSPDGLSMNCATAVSRHFCRTRHKLSLNKHISSSQKISITSVVKGMVELPEEFINLYNVYMYLNTDIHISVGLVTQFIESRGIVPITTVQPCSTWKTEFSWDQKKDVPPRWHC